MKNSFLTFFPLFSNSVCCSKVQLKAQKVATPMDKVAREFPLKPCLQLLEVCLYVNHLD